jgi:hypothetical protein
MTSSGYEQYESYDRYEPWITLEIRRDSCWANRDRFPDTSSRDSHWGPSQAFCLVGVRTNGPGLETDWTPGIIEEA